MKHNTKLAILLSFLAFIGLSGCGHKDHDGHGHEGHSHEETEHEEHEHAHDEHEEHEGHSHNEMLYLTRYSDQYEVFAEAQPFSVGEESHIIAYFTLLDSFKPIGEADITATLSAGGKNATAAGELHGHPGIYEFELTPEAAGNASLTFNIKTSSGASSVKMDNITVYADEHEAHHAAAESAAHVSNGATFPKEMSWKIDFSTETAQTKPFGEIIRTSGRIEPSSGDVSTIVAKASGTVHFTVPSLTVGSTVGAGQTLFRINPEVMAEGSLKVRLKEAASNFNAAKEAYDRGQKLNKEGIMSDTELLQLKNSYENAEASYNHLRSNFKGGETGAGSPIAGYITSIDVANGQYVEAGQPLATVARNRNLMVRADVPVRYARRLSAIGSASIRPMNSEEFIDVTADEGSVISIGKGVNDGNQRVPVVLQIPNTGSLMPGEFVDMYIRTKGGEQALTVPSDALIEQQGNWFVYVQVTPVYFEKRSVKPGRTDGTETEILSGLKEGERVVGKGAIMVKLSQASGALDAHAGHVH